MRTKHLVFGLLLGGLFAAAPLVHPTQSVANPCNPCGGKRMSNPCNPCGGKRMANPCNPCGGKMANPCNPCGGGGVNPKDVKQPRRPKMVKGDVKNGSKLWNDRTIGKSGLSCANCHIDNYGQMQPTFAKPYPHFVQMAKDRAGLKGVNAAEMVQLCMVVPMMTKPLAWDSQELADLTAYVEHIRPAYKPVAGGAANPCNPCGGKMANPCNPCAGKKMGNPCNPCGKKMKNPCNPCGR